MLKRDGLRHENTKGTTNMCNYRGILTFLIVLFRALWWPFRGVQKRKFAKIWATYKFGGIRLCWYRAVERFAPQRCKYDPKGNQLSQAQSNYILTMCSSKPFFSIIVPVYKINKKWLDKCIFSVVNQHYTNWELILVDDASGKDDLKQLMNIYASQDKRIRAYYLGENLGIAGATNFGIKQAKGEFIGFLDHDDELTPDALTWVVWALNKYPDAVWLYSDEDKVYESDTYHSPNFKPDFSPEFLLANMFTCHFSVHSPKVLNDVGGIRQGFDGSQDHDLALRLSEVIPREKIVHIPRVLYHWREIPSSAAAGIRAKPKAPLAGRKAVAEALERRNIKAKVTSYELRPTTYQITLQPTDFPKVSIIIPTKNSLSLVQKCIHSVRQHTSYPNYEILIVDNQSNDPKVKEYLMAESSKNCLKVIQYDDPFNHSDINNIAVKSTDSEFVVLMNNDVEIVSDGWLEQLVATAQIDDSIATVGGLLLYPDGRVQHSGIIWGLNGAVGHAHKYIHSEAPGYFGRLHALQEMSGITAALALVRRSSFEHVGGFDSNRYPTLYNDIDLCTRLRKKGYRCIYNPMVRAIHYETKTRPVNSEELVYKLRLASDYVEIINCDPFYNPNLALDNEQFHGFRPFPVEEQIPELATIPEEYRD